MSDWSEGYVTDIDYAYDYCPDLNPMRVGLAFANAGLVAPKIETACELGFGQGLSVNIHAAASAIDWYGTDFNPSQVGFAREAASASGASLRLFDDSFADFVSRTDLPDFDFIGLHGIWSWIDDKNRALIVEFLRRRLKVGGVLYISYNTQPGWASMIPMRELLTQHAEVMGAPGQGLVSRIDTALAFAAKLMEANPAFGRANPTIAERLAGLSGKDRHYLAHEYFNRDWAPMSFARMAEWLEPAKLGFACSATLLDHIDNANLTSDQQAFLNGISDPVFRQSVRDFMVNQQFRRDYWVKGARRLDTFAQSERLREQKVALVRPREQIAMKLKGAQGEIDLSQEIYGPVLDLLADHQPRTLGQMEQELQPRGVNFMHIRQASMVLTGDGITGLVQDEAVSAKARKQARKVNQLFCEKARVRNDFTFLVSPVSGGGLYADSTEMLFLGAHWMGLKTRQEWVAYAWKVLSLQGRLLVEQGQKVEGEEANLAILAKRASAFAENSLPILKVQGIVD